MIDFYESAKKLFTYTRDLRRDFHLHPELGFQEVRTAGIVAKELKSLGLEVTTGVGKTGVVAMIEGSKPGPTLLLRADMDALPIIEQNQTDYISLNNGVMHACGHDGHTAILLTVAKLLNEVKDELRGNIKLCFQPAEEGLGGAESMITDGVLENPKVDYVLGLHLWNEQPLGWLGVGAGPTMAGGEKFKIKIIGKGGHGAIPHFTVDPIVAGAQIVSALQSIVSRNVPAFESAVVSVTQFHSGDAFNVIPGVAELGGTIRTFDLNVREKVLERFTKIVSSTTEAMGCIAEIELIRMTPAVINEESIIKHVQTAAQKILPNDTADTSAPVTMGSEDFAYFMQNKPGAFFFVGSANTERGLNYAHHHPKFDFDEEALPRAAALFAASAMEILNNTK